AAGRLDAYWERGLSPWDMAAGIALGREAGGFITDLDGCGDMIKTGGLLAGKEGIHREKLRAPRDAHQAATNAQPPARTHRSGARAAACRRLLLLPSAAAVPYCESR